MDAEDIESAYILGHDMGGVIAQNLQTNIQIK